ncbi:ABC transporter permease [Pseudogracilibacillus sp. ICA-222130]|uniref:ABC transporter permease n=1 Tax=Pseudogracilibacillus sp. ICA-222130 TaxID=3134655 RepID=UPI0030BBF587
MQTLKHYFMFLQIYVKQSKRKWLTFPLILLSPIIMIGATLFLSVQALQTEEAEPIRIGIVNDDQSEEITMLIDVLMEAQEAFEQYVHMEVLDETSAQEQMDENTLSAYVVFPANFIEDLFYGQEVLLEMVGNKQKQVESIVVKEIVDSVMRHINTSQANILLINHYAKKFIDDKEVRNEFLFEQFMSFFMYALSKDKIVSTDEVTNIATSSLYLYYGLSAFFIISTIWLWIVYLFLYREEADRMSVRIRLYGVTLTQQLLAKLTIVLGIHFILSFGLFFLFKNIFDLPLDGEDYGRITTIFALYSVIVVAILAMIEMLITSLKGRLLLQLITILLFLISSGAIVPTIYFPLYVQDWLPYIYSYEALFWLQEIILNGRLYAAYAPLAWMAVVAMLLMLAIAFVKGRRTI